MNHPKLPPLLVFVVFSHGWTVAFWAIAASMPGTVWEMPGRPWFLIGGAGVLLAGVVVTASTAGPAGLVELARRTVDPRRAAIAVWAPALLVAPATTLAAAALVRAVDPAAAVLAPTAASPQQALGLAAVLLVLGPLPEEIGWRGVLLDRLLVRLRPLAATAVVAALWWSWHLPLHLLPGYFAAFAHPPDPWRQLAEIAALSILMTWLYRNTRRSVLIAVVFHWSVNVSGELLAPSAAVDAVRLALVWALALAVLGMGWPRLTAPREGRR